MNDIDASETKNWNEGTGFSPITSLNGTFEGNGYQIKNISITPDVKQVGMSNVALFSMLYNDGVIKNLHLRNCNVSAKYSWSVAGLVAENKGVLIENCSVTGNVVAQVIAGLLIGKNFGKKVTKCFATGSVRAGSNAGGLCGRSYGRIERSYADVTVDVTEYYAGGLIGINEGYVDRCYALGDVTGDTKVGGFIGQNYDTVLCTYSAGTVKGNGTTGGLIGIDEGRVLASFWDREASLIDSSAAGSAKTTAQMMDTETFTSNTAPDLNGYRWLIYGVTTYTNWYMDEGANYPHLRYESSVLKYSADSFGSLNGDKLQFPHRNSFGTEVTAVPETGYKFTGWSDGSKLNPRVDSSNGDTIAVKALFDEATAIIELEPSDILVKRLGVMAGPNPVNLASNQVTISVNSGNRATEIKIIILDNLGNSIDEQRSHPSRDGVHRFGWDLRNAKGQLVACGAYRVIAEVRYNDNTIQRFTNTLGVKQ